MGIPPLWPHPLQSGIPKCLRVWPLPCGICSGGAGPVFLTERVPQRQSAAGWHHVGAAKEPTPRPEKRSQGCEWRVTVLQGMLQEASAWSENERPVLGAPRAKMRGAASRVCEALKLPFTQKHCRGNSGVPHHLVKPNTHLGHILAEACPPLTLCNTADLGGGITVSGTLT
ncbi:hypothetical protein NDU88_007084 [Pleurodeles waltl]|uniref:Uncharacterized protein n=1 Tax=Pleurodeles waltl TaxID=8319 RepID=A0AAV7PN99_PLEWA|nr:hypothetical protein NDU88_007084 [Pleurodeles waltl]